jgi:hypothetical protein
VGFGCEREALAPQAKTFTVSGPHETQGRQGRPGCDDEDLARTGIEGENYDTDHDLKSTTFHREQPQRSSSYFLPTGTTSPGLLPLRNLNRSLSVESTRVVLSAMVDLYDCMVQCRQLSANQL